MRTQDPTKRNRETPPRKILVLSPSLSPFFTPLLWRQPFRFEQATIPLEPFPWIRIFPYHPYPPHPTRVPHRYVTFVAIHWLTPCLSCPAVTRVLEYSYCAGARKLYCMQALPYFAPKPPASYLTYEATPHFTAQCPYRDTQSRVFETTLTSKVRVTGDELEFRV